MTFKTEIEITPADDTDCGTCQAWRVRAAVPTCDCPKMSSRRGPACLAAEKAWREKNP